MKVKLATLFAAMFFLAALAMAADTTMTGWISDSICGAKGAHAGARECTIKCVKERGAKYVFVNDTDKKVYAVDNQKMAGEHAGHHVTVSGMVEGESLKLASIKMAPEKEMGKMDKMGKM